MTVLTHPVTVGIDGSPASELALDWAVAEAQRRRRPLELVHVPWTGPVSMDPGMWGTAVDVDAAERAADAIIEDARNRVATMAPALVVRVVRAQGPAARALVEASWTSEVVVLGAHGHGGFARAVFGSTSSQVATHAHCPVVVVRESTDDTPDRPGVVVGVDGSPASADAVGFAFEEAAARGVPLVVVHAWWADYAPGVLTARVTDATWRRMADGETALVGESVAGWAEKYPDVRVTSRVLRLHPVHALARESRGAELLVVGTRGHGGFVGLMLGSVSHGVLEHASCPVAVVRPRDEDTRRDPHTGGS